MIRPEARPQPYDRHVGRYDPRLAAELIAAAGITEGQRALDVGRGLGALTIQLARMLGETGVAAIDPSESGVETCRARVSEAEVIVAPVERLTFDDGAFRRRARSAGDQSRRRPRGRHAGDGPGGKTRRCPRGVCPGRHRDAAAQFILGGRRGDRPGRGGGH